MEVISTGSNNVKTTFIRTSKFKTIDIDVAFIGSFSKENATKRSLLTRLLTASTKKYPSKKALANKLYDLYNATLAISAYPSYKTSVTVFHLSIVNPKYAGGDAALLPEALAFLREVIFNPNAKDGAFLEKDWREQKRILRDNIKNIYNNKSRYALRELLRNMSRDEIISVSSLGAIEDLDPLTASDVYATYREMLEKENVVIFVTGDFDDKEMLGQLKILGDFKDNPKPEETVSEEERAVEKVKEVVEKQNINQAKLLMGFRTDVNTKSDKFPAALLFNAIFGGTFTSGLMQVVREEHSLAYYIASQIINDLKILIVTAGIDQNQYQLASDLVIKQLESYKAGNISDDLIAIGKENIVNELLEIGDSPRKLNAFHLRNYLHGMDISIPEMVEKIKNIAKEDLVTVARGIALDTVFLLAGEDYDG
ncbi:MAG TPA: pitrilysin family protein [Bacilli bacterium]|mgnify:CR=1 FL=1|jgi:predicted Zn-dependent peptidase|nr:pitrilysin family protein [Bacilli bacterium]